MGSAGTLAVAQEVQSVNLRCEEGLRIQVRIPRLLSGSSILPSFARVLNVCEMGTMLQLSPASEDCCRSRWQSGSILLTRYEARKLHTGSHEDSREIAVTIFQVKDLTQGIELTLQEAKGTVA